MSKVNKKALDAEMSSDEEVVAKPTKVVKKPAKKEESDESSEEPIQIMKGKTQRKESDKAKASVKKQKVVAKDSDDDSSEEVPQKKASVKKPIKKEESSDEESSEEKPKKVVPAKKIVPAKKKEESSDEQLSEEIKPKKVVPAKKASVKKDVSSDEDDSDEEEIKPKKPVAPVKKAPVKKEESSDEDDSDEEEAKPKKAAPKKEESSDDDDIEVTKPKQATTTALPADAYEELFIRNLSFNTTQESLAEFMGKYGDVEEVKILTDRETGRSKGFGFCKFYAKESAVAAINDKDNIYIDGRQAQIRYSNDNSQRQNQGGNQGGYQQGGNQRSSYAGDRHSIFVGNLSFKSNENSIKRFFSDCGNVVDVRIAKQPDGKMKGFAHVDFDSADAASNAVKKSGTELEGRELRIDQSAPRQGGSGGAGGFRGGRGGGFRGGRGGFRGGDDVSRAKKTGAMMPTQNRSVDLEDDD